MIIEELDGTHHCEHGVPMELDEAVNQISGFCFKCMDNFLRSIG